MWENTYEYDKYVFKPQTDEISGEDEIKIQTSKQTDENYEEYVEQVVKDKESAKLLDEYEILKKAKDVAEQIESVPTDLIKFFNEFNHMLDLQIQIYEKALYEKALSDHPIASGSRRTRRHKRSAKKSAKKYRKGKSKQMRAKSHRRK